MATIAGGMFADQPRAAAPVRLPRWQLVSPERFWGELCKPLRFGSAAIGLCG
jgi:hypothetical protein